VGLTRLTLAIVLAATLGVAIIPPTSRRRLGAALTQARWKFLGIDPDAHYRRAERYYEAGNFEGSRRACGEALRLRPDHAPARALFTEVEFILGQGETTLLGAAFERFMHVQRASEDPLLDMDQSLIKAEQFVWAGELGRAAQEYRKVLEYGKWVPASLEVGARTERATAALALLGFREAR
jgi:hypothetical protein